ncbi:MAG: hypothetical protein ABL897_10465 [Hyphomicrobium sp.]
MIRKDLRRRAPFAVIMCAAMLSGPAAAGSAQPMTAKDAGARYGQALGALEICHGSKITDKAKALGDAYSGAEQDAFKTQAAKVFAAWNTVKHCAKQIDPNQCKIIMDKSCETAEAEIGAAGSVLSGLVEFMKR